MSPDLIARFAEPLGLASAEARPVLTRLIESIHRLADEYGGVHVPGLGTFRREGDALAFDAAPNLADAINHRYVGLAPLTPRGSTPSEAPLPTLELDTPLRLNLPTEPPLRDLGTLDQQPPAEDVRLPHEMPPDNDASKEDGTDVGTLNLATEPFTLSLDSAPEALPPSEPSAPEDLFADVWSTDDLPPPEPLDLNAPLSRSTPLAPLSPVDRPADTPKDNLEEPTVDLATELPAASLPTLDEEAVPMAVASSPETTSPPEVISPPNDPIDPFTTEDVSADDRIPELGPISDPPTEHPPIETVVTATSSVEDALAGSASMEAAPVENMATAERSEVAEDSALPEDPTMSGDETVDLATEDEADTDRAEETVVPASDPLRPPASEFFGFDFEEMPEEGTDPGSLGGTWASWDAVLADDAEGLLNTADPSGASDTTPDEALPLEDAASAETSFQDVVAEPSSAEPSSAEPSSDALSSPAMPDLGASVPVFDGIAQNEAAPTNADVDDASVDEAFTIDLTTAPDDLSSTADDDARSSDDPLANDLLAEDILAPVAALANDVVPSDGAFEDVGEADIPAPLPSSLLDASDQLDIDPAFYDPPNTDDATTGTQTESGQPPEATPEAPPSLIVDSDLLGDLRDDAWEASNWDASGPGTPSAFSEDDSLAPFAAPLSALPPLGTEAPPETGAPPLEMDDDVPSIEEPAPRDAFEPLDRDLDRDNALAVVPVDGRSLGDQPPPAPTAEANASAPPTPSPQDPTTSAPNSPDFESYAPDDAASQDLPDLETGVLAGAGALGLAGHAFFGPGAEQPDREPSEADEHIAPVGITDTPPPAFEAPEFSTPSMPSAPLPDTDPMQEMDDEAPWMPDEAIVPLDAIGDAPPFDPPMGAEDPTGDAMDLDTPATFEAPPDYGGIADFDVITDDAFVEPAAGGWEDASPPASGPEDWQAPPAPVSDPQWETLPLGTFDEASSTSGDVPVGGAPPFQHGLPDADPVTMPLTADLFDDPPAPVAATRAGTPPGERERRSAWPWLLLVLLLLALPVAGYYLWQQLNASADAPVVLTPAASDPAAAPDPDLGPPAEEQADPIAETLSAEDPVQDDDPETLLSDASEEVVAPETSVASGLRGASGIDVTQGGYTWVVTTDVNAGPSAQQQVAQYRAQGFRSGIVLGSVDGSMVERVCLGQFATLESARQAQSQLPAGVSTSSWVLNLNSPTVQR